MGHEDIKTTMDIYVIVNIRDEEEAVRRLDVSGTEF
jgi:hypothetical protein